MAWTIVFLVPAFIAGALPRGGGAAVASPDDGAAAPGGAGAAGGTIAGRLQSLWLRKYPMIVYLEKVDGSFAPPEPGKGPTLDQKNKMFVPHVQAVLKGTTVKYVNNDDTKHNVYFVKPDGEKLNLGTGTREWSRECVMDQLGVFVHRCNVHDEMSAFIVVLQNPFFAVVQKSPHKAADFKIKGVPPGTYKLRVWCEKFYRKKSHKFNSAWEVTVKSGEETAIEVKPKSR